MATKVIEMPPISMLKDEEFYLKDYRVPYKPFNKDKTIVPKDMNCNITSLDRKLSPTSTKKVI